MRLPKNLVPPTLLLGVVTVGHPNSETIDAGPVRCNHPFLLPQNVDGALASAFVFPNFEITFKMVRCSTEDNCGAMVGGGSKQCERTLRGRTPLDRAKQF